MNSLYFASGLKVIMAEAEHGQRRAASFYSKLRNLQITISPIILKIFTPGYNLSSRHREGERKTWILAALCVHFPDGLSYLLPDLVCVVLHSPVICVNPHTALLLLHPFIHITEICVEFVTFGIFIFRLPFARSDRILCSTS